MISDEEQFPISSKERTDHPACPTWTPDHEQQACMRCKKSFSITNRRHHCRACGKLFDSKCSSHYNELSQLGYPPRTRVRVCIDCNDKPRNTKLHEKELELLCKAARTGTRRVKLTDLAQSLLTASTTSQFHTLLLEHAKKVLADSLETEAKDSHVGLVQLITLGDKAKISEILPVTNAAEDVLECIQKISDKAIGEDVVLKDTISRIGIEDFTELYESVRKVRESKLNVQREEQRYRECRANLEAVVYTNFTYEYTKEVIELAQHYLDQGRTIPKGTLEKAQAKLRVMEQVDRRISEHKPSFLLVRPPIETMNKAL